MNRLLNIFQIKNKEGIYNFSDFKKDSPDSPEHKQFTDNIFNKKSIDKITEDDLKEIIKEWIKKAEDCLTNEDKERLFANSKEKTRILWHYIQWKNALQISEPPPAKALADNLYKYLNNLEINDDAKRDLLSDLGKWCKSYNKQNGFTQNNPIDFLFNKDASLMKLILGIIDHLKPDYAEEIKLCIHRVA